jgi:hypothetical protein
MGRIIIRLPVQQSQSPKLPPQDLQFVNPPGRYSEPRWLDWTLNPPREEPYFPPRYRKQIPYQPTYSRTTLQPFNSGAPAPTTMYKLRLRMVP